MNEHNSKYVSSGTAGSGACPSYKKEIDFIFNRFPSFQKVGGSAYKPGLGTMEKLSAILGMPHERFQTVHIAGTNGKGSTSHMIAAALSQLVKPDGTELKVGLYTSPHLIDFRERMKVSVVEDVEKSVGKKNMKFVMPSREFVYDFLTSHKEDFLSTEASFFEITTAMAFYWFAQEGVDIAIVECGLGGRLDATNIVHPQLSVITNIGLDHCEYLGNTPEAVAGEKAGIIKSGVPVVIGERSGVGEVFVSKAAEVGAPIVFAEDLGITTLPDRETGYMFNEISVEALDLTGACQVKNLRTVKAALAELVASNRLVQECVDFDGMIYGVCNAAKITGLHGRWETLCRKPFVVCDTGHNAHGFALLGDQIKNCASGISEYTGKSFERLVMIFGVVADKDLDSIAEFLPRGENYVNSSCANMPNVQYYFVNAAGTRALPAKTLKEKMHKLGFEGEVLADGVICNALDVYMKEMCMENDFVFVGGSTFVVAEALEYFNIV